MCEPRDAAFEVTMSGGAVVAVDTGPPRRIVIEDGGDHWEAIIAHGFKFAGARADVVRDVQSVQGLQALGLMISESGELVICLAGIDAIALPDDRFEGWTLTGPRGFVAVARIGGGTAIWRREQPGG